MSVGKLVTTRTLTTTKKRKQNKDRVRTCGYRWFERRRGGLRLVAFRNRGGRLGRGHHNDTQLGLFNLATLGGIKQLRGNLFNRCIDLDALNKKFVLAVGVRDWRFPLGLQDDLDFFDAVALDDAAAGANTVLFG